MVDGIATFPGYLIKTGKVFEFSLMLANKRIGISYSTVVFILGHESWWVPDIFFAGVGS